MSVSAISGNVDIATVEAERLEAKTVSGDVIFAGAIARNGRYELNTHSGNARLTLAAAPGFELNANTFSGNIQSDLPVTVNEVRSRRGPGDRRARWWVTAAPRSPCRPSAATWSFAGSNGISIAGVQKETFQ